MCPEVSRKAAPLIKTGGEDEQEPIQISPSYSHRLSAGPSKEMRSRLGGIQGCHQRRGRATGSPISFLRECVCGYFCFVNRRQGVGQAGHTAMCICVYVWTCVYEREQEAFQEKLSGSVFSPWSQQWSRLRWDLQVKGTFCEPSLAMPTALVT